MSKKNTGRESGAVSLLLLSVISSHERSGVVATYERRRRRRESERAQLQRTVNSAMLWGEKSGNAEKGLKFFGFSVRFFCL